MSCCHMCPRAACGKFMRRLANIEKRKKKKEKRKKKKEKRKKKKNIEGKGPEKQKKKKANKRVLLTKQNADLGCGARWRLPRLFSFFFLGSVK